MSCDCKVDLFGLPCACCVVTSARGRARSHAGPSLPSLTSNVTELRLKWPIFKKLLQS